MAAVRRMTTFVDAALVAARRVSTSPSTPLTTAIPTGMPQYPWRHRSKVVVSLANNQRRCALNGALGDRPDHVIVVQLVDHELSPRITSSIRRTCEAVANLTPRRTQGMGTPVTCRLRGAAEARRGSG